MAEIHRLSEHLANQIAAGEVVERPASAAKELVENALDAGATRIDVVVGTGGRALRVTDDGTGMSPEDAALAFARFATSKIVEMDDLFALRTLGFRGEALASIAAVARVDLMTRLSGSAAGTRVRLVGGTRVEGGPHGCPDGTTIAVDDLFFNTPARLKFLKADRTEAAHVVEALTGLALAHPGVALTALNGDRMALDSRGARDMAETAAAVLGAEIGPRLLVARAEGEIGSIEGLVAPPELARGDRSKQWLIVNGRPIRHPALSRAVDEAYDGHVPSSRQPIYVLRLAIDPIRVDFNVHPTKREIRLADGSAIFALVRQAVSDALRQTPAARRIFVMGGPPTLSELRSVEGPYPQARPFGDRLNEALPARPKTPTTPAQAFDLYRPATAEPAGREAFPWADLRLMGQLHDTYIVVHHPEGIYLVDQHNSHERYLYEQLGPGRPAAQELLIPAPLDLPAASAEAVAEHRGELRESGFEVEGDAAAGWLLRAVPAILPAEEAEAALLALLEEAGESGLSGSDVADRWRITVACHSATKAGQRLTEDEMRRLLAQWRTCEQPFTCPHGRPTAVLVTLAELHRRCMRGMQTW